jgi:hypothetical protein
MLFNTNKDKGRAGVSRAIGYFGSHGYTVLIPLDDTQDYDIAIEKDGIFSKVQCKATGATKPSGNFYVHLQSNGGTKGTTYSSVTTSSADILFILTSDEDIYVIPIEEITQTTSITLQKESKYKV